MTVLGILGGSGVYDIAGLKNATWRRVASPFGETSDEFLFGVLDGLTSCSCRATAAAIVHSPTSINYRANIDALKRVGVTDILSLSACGSLREDLPPGHFVVVDQFIDRTFAREKSFFGEGLVAHVSMAHPTCNRLAAGRARLRAGRRASRSSSAAPTSRWKARNSPASPNRSSTAAGAAT